MKTIGRNNIPLLLNLMTVLAAFGATLRVAEAQSGGSYDLSWSTIDGGGGTSTGGVYAVSGTIGQPDAAWPVDQNGFAVLATGGNYTLVGGFWGILAAVETPGAPLLSIFRMTTNTVAVSWPAPSTGFTLQQNTNVVTTNWTLVGTTPSDDGTTKTIIINPPAGNLFFRLKK